MPHSVRRLLCVALLAGPAAHAGPPERGPAPHLVDYYGDPLPAGAVARLGSVRLRHAGLKDFALTPDGKSAVTVGSDATARWWDMETGRQSRAVKLPAEIAHSAFAVSPTGKAVAVLGRDTLSVCDSFTGRVEQTFDVTGGGEGMLFSPDESMIAFGTRNAVLTLVTRATKQVQRVRFGPDRQGCGGCGVMSLSFSGNGRRIVAGCVTGPGRSVSVMETADLKEIFALPAATEDAALSPDGARLGICTQFDDETRTDATLKFFDLRTRKETVSTPAGAGDGRFRVVFSPDEKSVACLGDAKGTLIDPNTGKLLGRLPAGEKAKFSADGTRLAIGHWNHLSIWDVAAGRPIHDRPGEFSVGRRTISTDGRTLAIQDVVPPGQVSLWDLTTGGAPLFRLNFPESGHHSPIHGMAFRSDGGTLTVGGELGVINSLKVRRFVERRAIHLWGHDAGGASSRDYVLSPDGRRVAAVFSSKDANGPSRLDVWDAHTGQVIHRHRMPILNLSEVTTWLPDGSAVFMGQNFLADPDTGALGLPFPTSNHLSVSADARLLGGWTLNDPAGRLDVFEVASARPVVTVTTGAWVYDAFCLVPAACAAVIADGKFLRVVDLATGKDRGRWSLPDIGRGLESDRPVNEVEALPGGQRVLTTLEDGTALVWDLAAFPPPALSDKHGEPELKAWWEELGGEDAAKAFAAGWKMSEAPAADVAAFLRGRLRPAKGVDGDEVRKLVADLDSPKYAAREAAARRLWKMGPAVLPSLREQPAGLSAEAAEWLGKLEARLADAPPPAETLRAVRAAAVLERLGTGPAASLLWELAGGAAGALETTAAKAAYGRLMRAQSWGRAVAPVVAPDAGRPKG